MVVVILPVVNWMPSSRNCQVRNFCMPEWTHSILDSTIQNPYSLHMFAIDTMNRSMQNEVCYLCFIFLPMRCDARDRIVNFIHFFYLFFHSFLHPIPLSPSLSLSTSSSVGGIRRTKGILCSKYIYKDIHIHTFMTAYADDKKKNWIISCLLICCAVELLFQFALQPSWPVSHHFASFFNTVCFHFVTGFSLFLFCVFLLLLFFYLFSMRFFCFVSFSFFVRYAYSRCELYFVHRRNVNAKRFIRIEREGVKEAIEAKTKKEKKMINRNTQ